MEDLASANQTPSSVRLAELGAEIAELCPAWLGAEIALTGSVAAGWADETSDLDLVLFVLDPPDHDMVHSFARKLDLAGAVTSVEGVDWHLIGNYQGAWVEFQWRTLAATEQLLDTVCSAQTTAHELLASAQLLAEAVALRTAGAIAGWQDRLAEYPESLARRVVARGVEGWRAPHRIETRWVLADRGQEFALVEALQADIHAALQVLFAVNRAWEPDWKWLDRYLNRLDVSPDQLDLRIQSVFAGSDPHEAVASTLQIVQDVLVLAEPEFPVSAQLANIQGARNHPSAPRR